MRLPNKRNITQTMHTYKQTNNKKQIKPNQKMEKKFIKSESKQIHNANQLKRKKKGDNNCVLTHAYLKRSYQ